MNKNIATIQVIVCVTILLHVLLIYFCYSDAVEESEEMQARPVYVAAVDLSCKVLFALSVKISEKMNFFGKDAYTTETFS